MSPTSFQTAPPRVNIYITIIYNKYQNINTYFKWMEVDSNHRSVSQQIYSLPPLATRELLRMNLLELVDGLEPPTG